ncbi:MAG: IPT/TIG domain-containing protein [Planctomycetes bacterium]|nr:IPT/TIG domain-containing protein [Planctomycetota bacterium]
MTSARRLGLFAGALVACAAMLGVAFAHVRLTSSSTGSGLKWNSPGKIGITINSTGSDDAPDGSHVAALRNAIAAWNDVPNSKATLVEKTDPDEMARTDWESDGVHLIWFDEDDDSGYFPLGSGVVAITPVWFQSDGEIVDADVLFNGYGFDFTTEDVGGAFDIQDVATHELGHLLGFDHSGWAGATMYPYVSPAVIEHRSLSEDEVHALHHVYPVGGFASITGTVRRTSDSTRVLGAHVVARDANGRTAASALSNSNGDFTLRGLSAGDWTLYATPLDYPVSGWNLSSGQTVQTDFQSTLGPTVTTQASGAVDVGNLYVGANAVLSLGRNNDHFPLRIVRGTTDAYFLRGAGLDSLCTLECSDPSITIQVVSWMNTLVAFDVTAPLGAERGHADLIVTNSLGDVSILPAALEVTPPDPVVTSVSVALGSDLGGTTLTLDGANFEPGARVVVGEHVYVDGVDATVVDDSTITLTTTATVPGLYDVVVLDPSGVEGRLDDGFEFAAIPTIATVFPSAGSDLGGTPVTIRGASFEVGTLVRIDGVTQTNVTLVDSDELVVITEPGSAGGPYTLEVENTSGHVATSVFAYAATPDPMLVGVAPASASTAGGDPVTISGANFGVDTEVWFGADAATGAGGVSVDVTLVDANTLVVRAPAHAAGLVDLVVRDGATGQATALAGAFEFAEPEPSGGGGGCATVTPHGPFEPRSAAEGLAPLVLAFALVRLARSRRFALR